MRDTNTPHHKLGTGVLPQRVPDKSPCPPTCPICHGVGEVLDHWGSMWLTRPCPATAPRKASNAAPPFAWELLRHPLDRKDARQ